jgi:hypothetical protein
MVWYGKGRIGREGAGKNLSRFGWVGWKGVKGLFSVRDMAVATMYDMIRSTYLSNPSVNLLAHSLGIRFS